MRCIIELNLLSQYIGISDCYFLHFVIQGIYLSNFIDMNNNRLISIMVIVAIILSIPLIGMQISDQVKWSTFDFIVAGILLLSVGFGIEVIIRNIKKSPKRILSIIMLIILFLIIWAELAVGIFNSPFAGS